MDQRDTTDHQAISNRRSRHLALVVIGTVIISAAIPIAWFTSILART